MALSGLFATGLGLRFWLLHLHAPLAYVSLEWLPACFDLFALGMLLAVLSSWVVHRDVQPRWLFSPAMPWLSWSVAAVMLWAVSHIGVSKLPLEHTAPARGLAQEVLYGLFAFFLLLPAVFGPQRSGTIRRALQWKPVAALGVVSYGVYLWHQAWVTLFLRWTGALFRVSWPEMFGVVLGLALSCAALSYLLVERPILKLKDRLGGGTARRARWSRPRRPPPSRTDARVSGLPDRRARRGASADLRACRARGLPRTTSAGGPRRRTRSQRRSRATAERSTSDTSKVVR